MPLTIAVGGALMIGEGVWIASLTPAEVRRLGTGAALGARSIVGLSLPKFDTTTGQLMFDPAKTTVLAVGDSEEAVLIDLRTAARPAEVNNQADAGMTLNRARKGDEAFLRASRALMSDSLVSLIKDLLDGVRQRHPGELWEGQARKWVNSPDNFVAITIQPRDRSFAIYARGESDAYDALSSIDVRRDRPGYVRFKLYKASQLEDALKIVLRSARG
jgi:hypothetical protein